MLFSHRPRTILLIVATVGGLGALISCQYDRVDTTNIPDNGTLQMSFDCTKTSLKATETCSIHGFVRYATSDLGGAGWIVDLLTSAGSLDSSRKGVLAQRFVTDSNGAIVAHFRAPADTGWVVFTLTGHGAIASDSIKVINPDPDAGDSPAVAAITLSPPDVKMKKGDSVLVTATFLDSSKATLAGRRGYFSTDNPAKAVVTPGPADKMWVRGIDTGSTILHVSRRAVLASAKVEITP